MKRRVALLVGYNGRRYCGLQCNKDTKTIEGAILDTLLDLGLVSETNSSDPSKVGMKSCSRTDKGVHASFNVVCVKMIQEPSEEVENKLREALVKKNIHLYSLKRVPRRFIVHKNARSRVYSYTIPTALLIPSSIQEEARILAEDDGSRLTEKERSMKSADEENEEQDEKSNGGKEKEEGRKFLERSYSLEETIKYFKGKTADPSLFAELMQRYVGTRNYKNFTIKSNNHGAKRFIKSVEVSEPYLHNGIECLDITIHGQSFLLHQIRKMVSFALLNARYAAERSFYNFEKVFSEEMHVPKAPAEYLFLREVTFEDYNNKTEEKIVVDAEERRTYEEEAIRPEVLRDENLIAWFKYLDAARFHSYRLEYLY